MTAIPITLDATSTQAASAGLCLDCNYPLQHLASQRCPECGRKFDPDDLRTMNMGRPLTAAAMWVLGPIRPAVHWLTWGAVGFTLWNARLPGGRFSVPGIALDVLVAIGLLWLAWPIVR